MTAVRRKSNAKRSNADQLPSPSGRNSLKSPVARLPIVKKSSTARQSNYGSKRHSTDFSTPLSIHQLAKDPNFDGFLVDESRSSNKSNDPFRFDEDEDPFSGRKALVVSPRPFFATENARSAAISANAAIHTQHPRRVSLSPLPINLCIWCLKSQYLITLFLVPKTPTIWQSSG